jgi:plasmid replication initiation protein
MAKSRMKKALPDSALAGAAITIEERGILESFFKLPDTEQGIIRQLLEKYTPGGAPKILLPIQDMPKRSNLKTAYKLIRYHRLTFETATSGAVHSTYLPWIASITHIKMGGTEEIEITLNGSYRWVWSFLKRHLKESTVRLKSQYSIRLYQWARQYLSVGHKRVSLSTLRKILGLEELRDSSDNVVQGAPLQMWASVKQRALDQALKEINSKSDIGLELELIGRGNYRRVQSLGFKIRPKTVAELKKVKETGSKKIGEAA